MATQDKTELARDLWNKAINIKGTLAQTYLETRIPSIETGADPSSLRFLPNARHSTDKKNHPCILSSFTVYPSNEVIAILRTFLNEDGTAKSLAEPQKMMLGPIMGCSIVLDQPTEHLIIAEGLETALSIRRISGLPTWSAGSASNLANTKLPPLPMASELTIACDNDENDAGLKAALKLAKRARQEGRTVTIIRPAQPHNDFNDVLLDAIKQGSEIYLEHLSELVDEAFEMQRLGLDSREEGNNQVEDSEIDAGLDHQVEYLGLDDDVAIAKHLLVELQKDYGEIIYSEGDLWTYPAGATHWQPLTDEHLKKEIQEYSGQKNIKLGSTEEKRKSEWIKLNKSRIDSILQILFDLKRIPFEDDIFFKGNKKIHGIPCLNGFIKIDAEKYQVISHDKDHRQKFNVPFKFNSELLTRNQIDWDAPPWRDSYVKKLLFGAFLEDFDQSEKIRLILQILGVAASCSILKLHQPKAFFFLGEGANNGKSQLLLLMKNLLSSRDVVSVDPEQFEDKHERIRLKNKRLNVVAEMSGNSLASHHYKQIITGDFINARRLHENATEFVCEALHVFATNRLPSSFHGGIDEGVKRRTAVLVFNRVIPEGERIVGIADKILDHEGELLLAMALSGLISVEQNNRNFSLPASSTQALEQWQGEADSVIGFSKECLSYCEGLWFTSLQSIYDRYKEWAEKSGFSKHRFPSKNAFAKRIRLNVPSGVLEDRKDSVRGFKNLSMSMAVLGT